MFLRQGPEGGILHDSFFSQQGDCDHNTSKTMRPSELLHLVT